jgi:two-component system chemotaxis response regulator CheB
MRSGGSISVLIVDDSVVVRGSLGRIIDAEPDLHVVTTAVNGKDALDALRANAVDVVLLDVEMPVMDGLTTLPILVEQYPTVRVIMASSLTHDGASVTMRALALGAADFVHKPRAKDGVAAIAALAKELTAKIRALGRSEWNHRPVIHRAPLSSSVSSLTPIPARLTSAAAPVVYTGQGTARDLLGNRSVVAIAASTGGPNALCDVLRDLPVNFPFPVLITQHMPPIFTTMLAQRIDRESALACSEACDGEPVQPGHIYVAPGRKHLTVTPGAGTPVVCLRDGPPENSCCPSADPMFRSVASVYGANVLAVVLTGMGDDGRRGCEAVVARGGRVLVQDEATSVVWGMPGSVVHAGVPCLIRPLHMIALEVGAFCGMVV